jgi:hypothetical protein
MISERLKKIQEENKRFEKESPCNFCDRWCERCSHEKQVRCTLYRDELERKITCVAHGRDPNDPEITEQVIRWQFEGIDEKLEKLMEEHGIDQDDIADAEDDERNEYMESIRADALNATAEQYRKKAYEFLKEAFFDKHVSTPQVVHDFETVAWYHTLLSVKLHRALCGFYEPKTENEIGLHDAAAQFEICKKAVNESIEALKKLKSHYSASKESITVLLVLLHNIHSRIEMLENSIR